MMKKKLFSLAVTLVMALSLAVPAMAADVDSQLSGEGSVTLKGTTAGKTYEFYRVFDLSYAGSAADDDLVVSYTINNAWTNFFADGGAGAGYIVDENTGNLSSIIVNGETKYINITEGSAAAFAEDALDYAASIDEVYTLNATEETMKVTGLPLGYYLIYPVGATQVLEGYASICSLTNTVPDAEANVKADTPEIDKTVNDPEVEIGQVVEYTITGQVPSTEGYESYTYKVTDTMSAGLTFNQDVTVKFGETVISTESLIVYEGNGFVLTFDMTKYQQYKFQDITITYTATVNDEAVVTMGNDYKLEYGNDPEDLDTYEPEGPVNVYTCKVTIDKYDGTTEDKLDGAKFVLYKMQGDNKLYYKYTAATEQDEAKVEWVSNIDDATVVVTDENGDAEFVGIQSGTYYVHETEAPAGYNLATEDQEVIVSANDSGIAQATAEARIANNTGAILPGTGGMGTTIFYVVGGTLVVAAAVLLITKKRMHNVED